MLNVTVTLTFDLHITKSIGIIYGSWPSMISRKVYLGEISLKVMSEKYIANTGQTGGCTDRLVTYNYTTESPLGRKIMCTCY